MRFTHQRRFGIGTDRRNTVSENTINVVFNDLPFDRQYSLCIQAVGMLQPHYGLSLRGFYLIGDIEAGHQGEAGYMKFHYTTAKEGDFILGVFYWRTGDNVPQIESCLLWLEALAADTELQTQTPLANRQGQRVTQLLVWDNPTDCFHCFCTLQRWLPGQTLWPHAGLGYRTQADPLPRRTDAQLRDMGRALALVHRHSSTWTRPDGFTRPPCRQVRAASIVDQYQDHIAEPHYFQRIKETAQVVDDYVFDFAALSVDKGLCHGDPNAANFVIDGGAIYPIDFDACGEGLYLADVGTALQAMDPQRRRAVLDGYSRERPLAPGAERTLEMLIVQWTIAQLESPWWTTSPLSPFCGDQPGFCRYIAAECERFSTGRPVLYEPSPLAWYKGRLSL